MAENSAIEWTDHTFNPWEGCQKVGPGCDHCYAETRNARFVPKDSPLRGTAPNWGPGALRRRTSPANWRKPLAWQADARRFLPDHGRRQRVFCASLADVFDNAVDPAWRADLFDLIRATPDLDWLLLTKRIGNVAGMVVGGMPHNVWLGATIVNQAEADRDIPKLLTTPARVRFLSMEPLLGPVNLTSMPCGARDAGASGWSALWREEPFGRGHIDWVIVGGESGPGARPMHPDWARSLRDQCAGAGVPFLFKQWGEWGPERESRGASLGRTEGAILYVNGWSISPSGQQHGEVRSYGKKVAGRHLDGRTHDGFPV
jgi:protein gp37